MIQALRFGTYFDVPWLQKVKYDAYEGGYQGSPLTSHDREELIAIYLREDIWELPIEQSVLTKQVWWF